MPTNQNDSRNYHCSLSSIMSDLLWREPFFISPENQFYYNAFVGRDATLHRPPHPTHCSLKVLHLLCLLASQNLSNYTISLCWGIANFVQLKYLFPATQRFTVAPTNNLKNVIIPCFICCPIILEYLFLRCYKKFQYIIINIQLFKLTIPVHCNMCKFLSFIKLLIMKTVYRVIYFSIYYNIMHESIITDNI